MGRDRDLYHKRGLLLESIAVCSDSRTGGPVVDEPQLPPVGCSLTRGITLIVTPTSLDTASSSELNVNLVVNEPDGGLSAR